ncbi:MAG TPA: hypothetical protein VLM42_04920 [Bryobacteraceae bacterium]|nr:hypothetical protein [Bryobacteraceae bacterium]
MAGFTAHIEGGMAAALFRNLQSDGVASQAKIFLLIAGSRFPQLLLVVRNMRVVALQAVTNRGAVNHARDLLCVFALMTGEAQGSSRSLRQFHVSRVAVYSYFVAGCAAHCNGGVDVFPFGAVFMAFQAFSRVRVLLERNRMNVRENRPRERKNNKKKDY